MCEWGTCQRLFSSSLIVFSVVFSYEMAEKMRADVMQSIQVCVLHISWQLLAQILL